MADRRELVTEALRQRLLRGLHAGSLLAGDRLPSARELEAEFDTDHRIILAAYRELAEEGLVEVRQRGGVYVAVPAGYGAGVVPISASWVTDLLTQGVMREIPISELHEWLRRSVETLRLRGVAIAGTSDQRGGLVRELRDDFGLDATGIAIEDIGDRAEAPIAVRRADLIVTTDAHRDHVGALASRLQKPCITISVRPDLIGGEWRFLLRKPVYVVVADERFVELLRKFFAGTPHGENLRPLVVGRDDLTVIPSDASVYVTQRAREILGATRISGRILPAARTISTESAREIIDFIVRANLRALATRPP